MFHRENAAKEAGVVEEEENDEDDDDVMSGPFRKIDDQIVSSVNFIKPLLFMLYNNCSYLRHMYTKNMYFYFKFSLNFFCRKSQKNARNKKRKIRKK